MKAKIMKKLANDDILNKDMCYRDLWDWKKNLPYVDMGYDKDVPPKFEEPDESSEGEQVEKIKGGELEMD